MKSRQGPRAGKCTGRDSQPHYRATGQDTARHLGQMGPGLATGRLTDMVQSGLGEKAAELRVPA